LTLRLQKAVIPTGILKVGQKCDTTNLICDPELVCNTFQSVPKCSKPCRTSSDCGFGAVESDCAVVTDSIHKACKPPSNTKLNACLDDVPPSCNTNAYCNPFSLHCEVKKILEILAA
uniref:Disintegrin domain-containing protein n=1 Tax=Rhabditophanes sp. KR3021 TaxID=114890 RepID=A0AC35TN76_9BILA